MQHQTHYWVTCPECGHQMEVRGKGAPLRARYCDECDWLFYFTKKELALTESVEAESLTIEEELARKRLFTGAK